MSSYEAARAKLIKPSPSITISTAAKEMRAAGEPVIDLSLGEPDFDTPPHVIEAAYAAMQRGETRYTPPDGTPVLKDAVLEKFRRENGLGFERANISCANGAKQVIFNALMATLEPGDEVICPAPYWVSYTDMTLLLGGAPKVIECPIGDGFKLTPAALEAAITPQSRWLMLNSPSNPSGATYSADELRALGAVRRARDGAVMETDTDLAGYLLRAGKVAGVQGAAFGLSPYFRISYALSRADLETAGERIRDALGALQ